MLYIMHYRLAAYIYILFKYLFKYICCAFHVWIHVRELQCPDKRVFLNVVWKITFGTDRSLSATSFD